MNDLEKLVNRFGKYPRLLSLLLGIAVRFVGTAGIYFKCFTKDRIVVVLKNRRKVSNHIGQVHAVGMTLLAETASGLITGINTPKGKTPLVKSIHSQFVRRSSGNITVEANFTPQMKATITNENKGEITFNMDAIDATGEVVAVFQAIWVWRALKK